MNAESKVSTDHLRRAAYLYIRQSTLQQVFENTESTQRQYALRRHAVTLGWPEEHIVVIDEDQGQSGASTAEREGFARLVAEVGLGKAGIVMGLEVSRLARNCADWHRLLEICALTHTLILDEDGLYDPGQALIERVQLLQDVVLFLLQPRLDYRHRLTLERRCRAVNPRLDLPDGSAQENRRSITPRDRPTKRSS